MYSAAWHNQLVDAKLIWYVTLETPGFFINSFYTIQIQMGELPFDLDEMSLRIPVVKLLMKKKMMMMMMLQGCNLEKKILATGIRYQLSNKRWTSSRRRSLKGFFHSTIDT
ncbi:hypothetical protein QQP08_009647 [Theobroma cacao]|nr:hypothetical protein QQP08_009647 [Theobroma cacao]